MAKPLFSNGALDVYRVHVHPEAAKMGDAGSGYAADMDLTPQVACTVGTLRFSKTANGRFLWNQREDA